MESEDIAMNQGIQRCERETQKCDVYMNCKHRNETQDQELGICTELGINKM